MASKTADVFLPRTLLGDNARALVLGRDRATGSVIFHPALSRLAAIGCAYTKRNGLADQEFVSSSRSKRT